jgi:hypothetical protein
VIFPPDATTALPNENVFSGGCADAGGGADPNGARNTTGDTDAVVKFWSRPYTVPSGSCATPRK